MKPLTQEQRDLVQAVLDGKTLQMKDASGLWSTFATAEHAIGFLFARLQDEFRIKPEPRKSTVKVYANRSGIFLHKDPAFPAATLDHITVTYYPDEPDSAKRVTAVIEEVKS